MQEERELFRRIGIKVPESQIEQFNKIINSNPAYKEQLDKIRALAKNPPTEDDFLKEIITYHKDKLTPPNTKVTLQQGTYCIRAIDPEDIKSSVERAFFNSFSIQRNIPNDLASQKNGGVDPQQEIVVLKNITTIALPEEIELKQTVVVKTIGCCQRELPGEKMVRCDNGQQNCRGSVWYHYTCAGFTQKDNVERQSFICNMCKEAGALTEPLPTKKRKA